MKYLILLALSANAFASVYSIDSYLNDKSKIFCENSKVKNCESKHRSCARELIDYTGPAKNLTKVFDECLKKYSL